MKLNVEELAKQAGISVDLWRMGAASHVYTEGCHGVALAEFEAFTSLIVERCAAVAEDYPKYGEATAAEIRNLLED